MLRIFLLTLLLTACQSNAQNVEVGKCYQAPDDTVIYKVQTVNEEEKTFQATIINRGEEQEVLITLNSDNTWVPVNCPSGE